MLLNEAMLSDKMQRDEEQRPSADKRLNTKRYVLFMWKNAPLSCSLCQFKFRPFGHGVLYTVSLSVRFEHELLQFGMFRSIVLLRVWCPEQKFSRLNLFGER